MLSESQKFLQGLLILDSSSCVFRGHASRYASGQVPNQNLNQVGLKVCKQDVLFLDRQDMTPLEEMSFSHLHTELHPPLFLTLFGWGLGHLNWWSLWFGCTWMLVVTHAARTVESLEVWFLSLVRITCIPEHGVVHKAPSSVTKLHFKPSLYKELDHTWRCLAWRCAPRQFDALQQIVLNLYVHTKVWSCRKTAVGANASKLMLWMAVFWAESCCRMQKFSGVHWYSLIMGGRSSSHLPFFCWMQIQPAICLLPYTLPGLYE